MGIRGLQTYIEKYCHNCCYEVNIAELAAEYRKETNGCQPVIVVDGHSCLSHIYRGLDWISGGQHTEYIQQLEKFVKSFIRLGIKLVFFFGSGTVPSKRKEWIRRCYDRLDKTYRIFDSLATGFQTHQLDQTLYCIPPGIGTMSQHYLKNLFGCEVHLTLDECDTEIAHYAHDNNCFAILAQDSDYLIYEGGRYYLSALHLNINSMKTLNYDRLRFAEYHRLHPSQLPVFATLAGNDLVSQADVRPFHRFLYRRDGGSSYRDNIPYQVLFPAIADFIRSLPAGDAIFQVLPQVAKQVLNDPRSASLLANSIRSYLPSTKLVVANPVHNYPQWSQIICKAEELHRSCVNVSTIFCLLNGEPFETSTTMEDFRCPDLPPIARILRPMRQRLYGILFLEKPSHLEPLFIVEWCMEGPNSLNQPVRVKPVPPQDYHPGLLALWSQDHTEEIDAARWHLYSHAISPRLNAFKLKSLPQHLVIPTATLFYIIECRVLYVWEVEALIATLVSIPTVPIDRLASLPSDPVDLRAVRISTFYLRCLWTSIIVFSACGYPIPVTKVFSHPFFEGKLFQQKYRKAKDKASPTILCGHRVTTLEHFQQVKSVLFDTSN